MNDLYKRYAVFLDELRIEANLTELDFCFDVCHDRTYRKYLSGESNMSNKVLFGLCKKLGFTIEEFFYAYDKRYSGEYQKVYELLFSIRDENKKKSKRLIQSLERTHLTNFIAERLLSYCAILYTEIFKTDVKLSIYDKYCSLIDYPNVLSKVHFDIIDILCLHRISLMEISTGKHIALNFLYKLLTERDRVFVSSESRNILPSIYSVTSKGFGMIGDLDKSLLIAEKGIEHSLSIGNFYDLHNMYYYKSLCLFKMGLRDQALNFAKKCLYTLDISEREEDYKYYYDLLHKDFKIEPSTYLKPID